MAHAAFETFTIYSQFWQLNLKDEIDMDTFVSHKNDAFDQYRKASLFIMETFNLCKKEYGIWG